MSAYKVVECEIEKGEYIIAGLVDMGIPRDQIEVHGSPVSLRDYNGRKTDQRANIVVRRENFKNHTRARYNADLGFEKKGNGYATHINMEEQRWFNEREPRFKQVAAAAAVTDKAKKRGYHVKKIDKGENIKLQLIKNF